MDLYLSRERINIVKNVLNTTITQEESLEIIVPDALPDVLRIISADATVLVRGKETDSGRVSVTGVAAAVVLYAPDGADSVRRLSLEIPFNLQAADSEITSGSKVTVSVAAASSIAEIINPRKLSVRVELYAEIACFNPEELVISNDAEPDESSGIELLSEVCAVTTCVDVREKPFVVSDELPLPGSGSEIGEILKTGVTLTTEEARVVGNKLIFRGITGISLLYNSTRGELCSAQMSTEFSQIMELDTISEDGEFDISLMLTGAYFEIGGTDGSENKALSIELHIVAQCVAAERKQIPYISDVYSTKFLCNQTSEIIEISSLEHSNVQNIVVRDTLEDTTAARVVSANITTGSVEISHESKTMSAKVPLYATVIYEDESGGIFAKSGRFTAETTFETHESCQYTIKAMCGKDIYCTPSGNTIELRIPVDFTALETKTVNLSIISDVAYDEDSPIDTSKIPSLTLSRMTREDSLWILAKRHHSTKTLILSANGLDSEEDIPVDDMLIIPKKR